MSISVQNDYDRCVEIVRNVTDGDPLAVLEPADVVVLYQKAIDMGYTIPDILTVDLFLSIYEDLKPEED